MQAALAMAGITLLLLTGCTSEPQEQSSPSAQPVGADACATLEGKTVAGVTVTAVKYFDSLGESNDGGFCQVSGSRAPLLDIEVDLPDAWSERFVQQGGGGFNGSIQSAVTLNESGDVESVHPALETHGAIYAASNGGNRADVPDEAAPEVWASDTDVAKASLRDYAFGSLRTTMQFAKGLASEYYGSEPRLSYFNGCSNGGREAYIVAQRWPTEFDGIVSGCEPGDMTAQTAAWLNIGSRAGTAAELSVEQYKWAYSKAVEACDSDDGVEDGYLANPAGCDFDPGQLSCGSTGGDSNCLTDQQVGTLRALLTPMTSSDGEVVYDAFTWSDFSSFAPSFGGLGGGYAMIATEDPSWLTPSGQSGFSVDDDIDEIGYGLLQLGADHDREAIASYVAGGGKLLSWHAAGDNLLSAKEHGRMHQDLVTRIERLGVTDPSRSALYLQVPSSHHGGGSDLSEVDWLSAIIDWVEHDEPPVSLTYTFAANDGTRRGLPVCEYPEYPAYTSGEVNNAESYECRGS